MSDGGTGGADLEVMFMPLDEKDQEPPVKQPSSDSFIGGKLTGEDLSRYQCDIYQDPS